MSSEWMKVMLEEIARKRTESDQDRAELDRRRADGNAVRAGDAASDGDPTGDRGPADRGPADRGPG